MVRQDAWYEWCSNVVNALARIQSLTADHSVTLNNIEKSLVSYHKMQKRMLYLIAIGFFTVITNGLLLFYK